MPLSIKIFVSLISILPLALVFSIFIADTIVVITGVYFLYYLFKLNNYDLIKSDFFIIGIILWIYFIFLSLISNEPFHSLESSLFYFRFIFFAVFVNFIIKKYPAVLKFILLGLFFVFLLLIIDSYYQLFFKHNFFGYEYNFASQPKRQNQIFITSFFNDEKILGSFLIRLLPVLLGLFFYIFKKNLTFYLLISILLLILLTEIIILFTGERTAIFLTILFNFLCLLFIKEYRKYIFIFFIFITCILTLILILNQNTREYVVKNTFNQLTFNNKINIFSYEHEAHFKSALLMFKDKPLFGVGPKMFRKECTKEEYFVFITPTETGCSTHPHNIYIQALSETGLPIFLLLISVFLFINIKLLFYCFRIGNYYQLSSSKIFFYIAVYLNLWPLIPSGNFFNNWISIIYFLPLCFLINTNYRSIYKYLKK